MRVINSLEPADRSSTERRFYGNSQIRLETSPAGDETLRKSSDRCQAPSSEKGSHSTAPGRRADGNGRLAVPVRISSLLLNLDEGGLAWEFLRRNRRYRDEHAALVGAADLVIRKRLPAAGGCDFVADPADRADRATVFWDPEANSKVILLAAAPEGHGGLSFTPDEWVGNIERRDAGDGTHIIIIYRARGTRHQTSTYSADRRRCTRWLR